MIRPLGFCVLVRPDPPKEALKSNMIHIPDSVHDKFRVETQVGTIVGVGSKAWKDLADGEPWAKEGDHVIYAKYGGKILTDPETDEKLVLLQDKDIIGLI